MAYKDIYQYIKMYHWNVMSSIFWKLACWRVRVVSLVCVHATLTSEGTVISIMEMFTAASVFLCLRSCARVWHSLCFLIMGKKQLRNARKIWFFEMLHFAAFNFCFWIIKNINTSSDTKNTHNIWVSYFLQSLYQK